MKTILLLFSAGIATANVLPLVPYAEAKTTPTAMATTTTTATDLPDAVRPRGPLISFPSNCEVKVTAVPGDTCQSMADKNGLALSYFVKINPQIGGMQYCPQNLWAYNDYCVRVQSSSSASTQAKSTSAPPPSKTTLLAEAAVSTTTAPPRCLINDCWRAYRMAAYGAKTSQSSWCTWLLNVKPPVTEEAYSSFPGVGPVVKQQCARSGGLADDQLSSMCRCYLAGNMEGSTSFGVSYDGPPTYPWKDPRTSDASHRKRFLARFRIA